MEAKVWFAVLCLVLRVSVSTSTPLPPGLSLARCIEDRQTVLALAATCLEDKLVLARRITALQHAVQAGQNQLTQEQESRQPLLLLDLLKDVRQDYIKEHHDHRMLKKDHYGQLQEHQALLAEHKVIKKQNDLYAEDQHFLLKDHYGLLQDHRALLAKQVTRKHYDLLAEDHKVTMKENELLTKDLKVMNKKNDLLTEDNIFCSRTITVCCRTTVPCWQSKRSQRNTMTFWLRNTRSRRTIMTF